jgi:hypothetical protein
LVCKNFTNNIVVEYMSSYKRNEWDKWEKWEIVFCRESGKLRSGRRGNGRSRELCASNNSLRR